MSKLRYYHLLQQEMESRICWRVRSTGPDDSWQSRVEVCKKVVGLDSIEIWPIQLMVRKSGPANDLWCIKPPKMEYSAYQLVIAGFLNHHQYLIIYIYIWLVVKLGQYPQIIHFNKVSHYKPSILGWETPILGQGMKGPFFLLQAGELENWRNMWLSS